MIVLGATDAIEEEDYGGLRGEDLVLLEVLGNVLLDCEFVPVEAVMSKAKSGARSERW